MAVIAKPQRTSSFRQHRTRERTVYFLAIACVLCVLSVALFFRQFFASKFTFIAGDEGDSRLLIALLEHWRAVLHGQASFRSPNFFWPAPDVLGYSDALFLFTVPYTIARAVTADTYIAYELTLMAIKAVGFFSMLWLLRSFVGVSRSVALTGAVLFTVSNMYFIWTDHGQLQAVVFLPLLLCLGCAALRSHNNQRWNVAGSYGAATGVLLGLLLFTAFYIGWFAMLSASITLLFTVLQKIIWPQSPDLPYSWLKFVAERKRVFLAAFLGFCVAMIPFAMTYLPVLRLNVGPSFHDVLTSCPHPMGAIDVGRLNWLWGRLIDAVMLRVTHKSMQITEAEMGWPPLIVGVVIAGVIVTLRRGWARKDLSSRSYQLNDLIPVIGASCFLCWLLSLNVREHSLWWFVFRFIPGGAAIRVPSRINFVLNIPVIVIACVVLDSLQRARSIVLRRCFIGLSALLLIEEANLMRTHWMSRPAENAILARVDRPPTACASFFLAHPLMPHRPFKASNQIDAMLVARRYNIPTLNGYSGWAPPGWNFFTFDEGYFRNAERWAEDKHVATGLCGLDLRDGSWSEIELGKAVPYTLRLPIDFSRGGDASLYEEEGWGEEEASGSWTVGTHSVLALKLPSKPATGLLLSFNAVAFTPPQHPRLEEVLRVNGSEVANWSVTREQPAFEKRVYLSRTLFTSDVVRLEFFNHEPRSPMQFGLSPDARMLGLYISTLKLEPAGF